MSLLPLSQAVENMLACLPLPTEIEHLNLTESVNRICAENCYSPINIPSFDNSAMDGYALRVEDLTDCQTFEIIGKAFAGKPCEQRIGKGECVRIMTGAKIPLGANAVIMQEESTLNEDGSVSFHTQAKLGENIRKQGEDILHGQLVLNKGDVLNVTNLPLLASLGIQKIAVFRPLTVAILSTGDELVSVGEPLKEGQIYDSNRFAIRLLLEKFPVRILDYGILPDDPNQFEYIFTEVQQLADVIITTGGVSVGEADFTKTILEKLGTVNFWKIAMKPGKPFAFGKLGKAHFFGLPGNPVSALVTFYQLVQPALMKLSGMREEKIANFSPTFTACAATPLKKAVGRQDFQRGFYWLNEQGKFEVKNVGMQGSHIFSSFQQSNCFIVLEQERGNVAVGEQVTIQPFNWLLSEYGTN